MADRRLRWILVFVVVVCATLVALRTLEAQGGGLEGRVAKLESTVATLERNAVKNGDRLALKTKAGVFIGATDGQGEVNTQTADDKDRRPRPGHPPRNSAGADETFTVQKQ